MPSLARRLVKYAAAGADRVRPPAAGVVVLIYHAVGGGRDNAVDLPVELFRQQVAYLAEHCTVLDLDAALDVVAGRAPLPPRAVVITFDDGTADLVDHALPVLADHGLPALLYVATGFVGAERSLWGDDGAITWDGLRELVDSGVFTLGSHTHSHRLLDRLDTAEVIGELDRSVELLGEHVGVRAEHFAYPKALPPTPAADEAVRARFRSAALAGTRPNRVGATDAFALARSPVQVADGMRWFTRKVDGGMGLEDRLRDVANRRRYAGATS